MSNITANSKTRAYKREHDDWYVEPTWCVDALIEALPWSRRIDTIMDPCCGGGTVPDVFAARGFDTCGSDIEDRTGGRFQIADFLSHTFNGWDLATAAISIVMNPPYNQAEAFIRKAIGYTDHRVCALMPLSFLASQRRHKLFSEHVPSDILIFSKRPSMPPGRQIADMGKKAFNGGTVDYCWIVWTRGWDRDTRTKWVMPNLAPPQDEADTFTSFGEAASEAVRKIGEAMNG